MAIINYHANTQVREVLYHEPGSNYFLYNDDFGDDILWDTQQYYLEAKLELLDGPEEWFYDMDSKVLYLRMPENEEEPACPDTDSSVEVLRGRTIDNVMEITGSAQNIIVANITFWASNVIADDVSNKAISFDSLIFEFPSSSHRMLKSEEQPKNTKVFGRENAVINCTFYGGEGGALHFEQSDYLLIHNNAFSYNDWVGQGDATSTIMDIHNHYGEISQNTLSFNGVNVGLRYTGRNQSITMNYMEGQCWGSIQADGGAIQVSPDAQNFAVITNHWILNSPKNGIRFDGSGELLPDRGIPQKFLFGPATFEITAHVNQSNLAYLTTHARRASFILSI